MKQCKGFIRVAVGLLLVVALMGCGLAMQEANRNKMLTLRIGMSHDEVIQVMGNPTKRECYKQNGHIVDVLYYWTKAVAENHYTPIVLLDDEVVGWGDEYLKDWDLKIKIE